MTIKSLLLDYADKKTDAISTIRIITGGFGQEHAVDLLAVVCQITRVEQGDLDIETFRHILGLGSSEAGKTV